MPASYNGWPASDDPGSIGIDPSFTAAGIRFPQGVKAGDVATIFADLVAHLVEIDPPTSTDPMVEGFWGYEYRPNVNDPASLSCHSSGTAIDWRAVAHPNGGPAYGGWTDVQIGQVWDLLDSRYDGLVDWLADQPTPDPMHFEIHGDAGEIAVVAARLAAEPNPGDDPMTDDDRRWISDEIGRQLADLPDSIWRRKVTGPGTGSTGLPADEVIRRTGRSTGALPDDD